MTNTGEGAPIAGNGEGARRGEASAGRYAWYALGVLTIVYTLNFIDRQILSILAEDVRRDLDLDDAQLGFLYGTVFAIFYTVFGIPLGRLADTWYRGRLMALGLALWSGMTALSGLATTYFQLAVARVGVGVGEASASPAAFSMLASYFPSSRRALAFAIYSAGVYLGMGLSLPLGGWISSSWDAAYAAGGAPFGLRGWQATFILVGLPGLLVAAWVASLREPPRVDAAGAPQPVAVPGAWRGFLMDVASILPPFTLWRVSRFKGALGRNVLGLALIAMVAALLIRLTGDWAQWVAYASGVYAIFSWSQSLRRTDPPAHALIWGHWAVPTALLGFGSLAVITYAFGFWAAPYAIRTFDVPSTVAGAWIGLPGALASAIGVIVGGRLSDAWRRRDPRGRVFTCMISAAAAGPLILIMFNMPDFQRYALVSPLVYFAANLWAGSAVATYQDLVLPRMYGTIGAIYLLGSTMVGLALGPYGSGKVAAVTGSLQAGVFSLLVVPPIALLSLWLLARMMVAAEKTKEARAAGAATANIL